MSLGVGLHSLYVSAGLGLHSPYVSPGIGLRSPYVSPGIGLHFSCVSAGIGLHFPPVSVICQQDIHIQYAETYTMISCTSTTSEFSVSEGFNYCILECV